MSQRDAIQMSEEEVLALLDEERTVVCATNGRRGWPHLMPLWYVVRPTGDGGAPQLWAWTFAKSQKARNLERDPRATLQVEAGERYASTATSSESASWRSSCSSATAASTTAYGR